MRQILSNHHKSLRHLMGMRLFSLVPAYTASVVIAFALAWLPAHAQTSPGTPGGNVNTSTPLAGSPAGSAADSADDDGLTREEILALFQLEARAAYQMNKEACEGLPAEDKKICLARARLQFDSDMRYAQKRADQGY